jgi:hypothetical protein
MIHHFDLAIEVHPDGTATATLNSPGSFDTPIAETTAANADKALVVLAGMLTIPSTAYPVIQCCEKDTPIPLVCGVPAGCSSPNGHYVGLNVVWTALDLGWQDTMAAAAAETYDEHYADEGWPYADHWHDIVDDAEKWLNEHTTGGLWHWADGDFRLDLTEVCPQCGDQRFADADIADDVCGEHLSWD